MAPARGYTSIRGGTVRPTAICAAAALILGATCVGAEDFPKSIPPELSGIKKALPALIGKAPPPPVPIALNFDPDVADSIIAQMDQDLFFVHSIAMSQPSAMHRDIYGPAAAGFMGPAYLRWFADRVKAVGFDDTEDPGGTTAYTNWKMVPPKMFMTTDYTQEDVPQMARVGTLFHEARHMESQNGFWRHGTCPKPFQDLDGVEVPEVAGGYACDQDALGAYGSSLIMLKNIQKSCANCSEKVRMDSGLWADRMLRRIIDAQAHRAICQDLYQGEDHRDKQLCLELAR